MTSSVFSWRRLFCLLVAASAVIAALLTAAGFSAKAPTAGPPTILIVIDTLRADHLSCYGYQRATTPHIDALARDAVVFTQAIAPSTFTKTSIASLMTGLDPHHHGVYLGALREGDASLTDVLSDDLETLAEGLSRRGVVTAAWVQNGHLRSEMGFAQGFSHYADQAGDIGPINDQFLRWLRRHDSRKSFFSYLHYLDLHGPNYPLPAYSNLFGHFSDLPGSIRREDFQAFFVELRSGTRRLAPQDIEQFRANYDCVLRYVDDRLGELFSELREMGCYDDATIILTSDHGEGFFEHGILGHAATPFDELIRIPLIVKLPGSLQVSRRVDDQVRLIDVAPTILALMVGGPSSFGDASDLSPLMHGTGSSELPRIAISEFKDTIALRSPRLKRIEYPLGLSQLFDLRTDPAERFDLRSPESEEAFELERKADAAIAARRSRAPTRISLDREILEELVALGYAEHPSAPD